MTNKSGFLDQFAAAAVGQSILGRPPRSPTVAYSAACLHSSLKTAELLRGIATEMQLFGTPLKPYCYWLLFLQLYTCALFLMRKLPMRRLKKLFDQNREWSDAVREKEPDFFEQLSQQQAPKYLWIGCSDSRVPANQITGMVPGELFVHRNVANQVIHTDLNCLSVIQFAVEYLKVEHIIVTGHYGCGGVQAAVKNGKLGLIDNWLRHIQDVQHKHQTFLDTLGSQEEVFERMYELNVVEQALNVCQTPIVRDAWLRGQDLTVHSWIYGLKDGLLRDLGLCVSDPESLHGLYSDAIRQITSAADG